MKKQIANFISIARIILSLPMILCFSISKHLYKTLSLQESFITFGVGVAIFTVAALSDYLDGYFARKYKSITKFGEVLDPVADKILINTFLFGLSYLEVLSFWSAALFLFRDTVVDAFRMLKISHKIDTSANVWGKTKTFLQMIGIVGLVVFLLSATEGFKKLESFKNSLSFWVANSFLYPALIASWISGTIYLTKWNRKAK